jgi:hypothetical protein
MSKRIVHDVTGAVAGAWLLVGMSISWPRLTAGVKMERIPSWVIQNSLRKYGQDLPERKGSDLTEAI